MGPRTRASARSVEGKASIEGEDPVVSKSAALHQEEDDDESGPEEESNVASRAVAKQKAKDRREAEKV